MHKFLFLLILLFSGACYAINMDTYPLNNAHDQERFQTLTQEIRCVVCQNQSIAESNASLAKDLRTKIYQMILLKKSNDWIKKYLSQRYGEYILLSPNINKLTLGLWLFPIIGIFCILWVLGKCVKI